MNCDGIGIPYVYFMQMSTDKLSHDTGLQVNCVSLGLSIILNIAFIQKMMNDTLISYYGKFFRKGLTLLQLPADHSWCEGHEGCPLFATSQLPQNKQTKSDSISMKRGSIIRCSDDQVL